MNRAVDLWNQHVFQPKYDGPDSAKLDDEATIKLESVEMAERKNIQTAHQRLVSNKVLQTTGARTVSINKHSVTDLAIYGGIDRVESLLRETHRTVRRLRLKTGRSAAFNNPSRGRGAPPALHDVTLWLNSLSRKSNDIGFLKRLYKTLRRRCSPEFLKALS